MEIMPRSSYHPGIVTKREKNTVAKDVSPFAMNIAQQKKKNLPSNELQTANPLEQGHGRQGQKEAAFARNV